MEYPLLNHKPPTISKYNTHIPYLYRPPWECTGFSSCCPSNCYIYNSVLDVYILHLTYPPTFTVLPGCVLDFLLVAHPLVIFITRCWHGRLIRPLPPKIFMYKYTYIFCSCIRDWILLVCFSWRYEATEVPRVNFVMREALFEIYTWILCRFIPSWETNK